MFDFLPEWLVRGGPVMAAIVACSITSLAIILERLFLVRATKKRMDAFLVRIQGVLKFGHLDEVERKSRESPNPLSRIFLSGLERIGDGPVRITEAVQAAGEKEARRLHRHVDILATIVAGAPLLGFLGTVLGMIRAFQAIEALGGNVNASVLAGGIWEAMLTTAAGLSVAVPTLFAHNYIVSRIRTLVGDLEDASQTLLDSLRAGETASAREGEA
jgi:biopolymer transport protein ExbB